MTVQIIKDGKVVCATRNLRGILEYARRQRIGRQTLLAQVGADAKTLRVAFPDEATCVTEFASAAVLEKWIADRVKHGRGKFKAGRLSATDTRLVHTSTTGGSDESTDNEDSHR